MWIENYNIIIKLHNSEICSNERKRINKTFVSECQNYKYRKKDYMLCSTPQFILSYVESWKKNDVLP